MTYHNSFIVNFSKWNKTWRQKLGDIAGTIMKKKFLCPKNKKNYSLGCYVHRTDRLWIHKLESLILNISVQNTYELMSRLCIPIQSFQIYVSCSNCCYDTLMSSRFHDKINPLEVIIIVLWWWSIITIRIDDCLSFHRTKQ